MSNKIKRPSKICRSEKFIWTDDSRRGSVSNCIDSYQAKITFMLYEDDDPTYVVSLYYKDKLVEFRNIDNTLYEAKKTAQKLFRKKIGN